MQVRQATEKDFLKISAWWKAREGVFFDPRTLSQYTYVAFSDQRTVAALTWYPTVGAKIAWIGWPIANHKSTKNERDVALELLFAKIHTDAKALGYSALFTTSGHSGVEERLEELDYRKGDQAVTQYFKKL